MAYQKKGQTFINELSRQTAFRDGLKSIKLFQGKHITTFLNEVKCTSNQLQMKKFIDSDGAEGRVSSCGTLYNYENSRFKVYKLQVLSKGNPIFSPLSTFHHQYINNLLEGAIHKPCGPFLELF